MYSLIYSPKAQRDINKLDRIVQKRLDKSLERMRENPLDHAEKLKDPSIGNYRFRVGSFRIIFDIEEGRIIVLRIGHRREIYR